MKEIDVEAEKAKYQAELNQFVAQAQVLDGQRAQLAQAIQERRGILGYLGTLGQETK